TVGDAAFPHCLTVMIGRNPLRLPAAHKAARALGYETRIPSSSRQGETRDIARMHAAIAQEMRQSGALLDTPACVISGGETTVSIRGNGKGGRNQEFVLAAALDIADLERVVVRSGGTDGTDGPTDATGAVADGQ